MVFERLLRFYWAHQELVDGEVEQVKGSALLQFLAYLDLRPCRLYCKENAHGAFRLVLAIQRGAPAPPVMPYQAKSVSCA